MKHLMRGVSLGLFDEKTAMEKFEKWNGEHETLVAKRDEAHRTAKREKRHSIHQESVRRVEEKQKAKAAAAAPAEEEITSEANTTEEIAGNNPEATSEEA